MSVSVNPRIHAEYFNGCPDVWKTRKTRRISPPMFSFYLSVKKNIFFLKKAASLNVVAGVLFYRIGKRYPVQKRERGRLSRRM
jgi:hypothetical protein